MAGAVGPGEEWEAAGLPHGRREGCAPRGDLADPWPAPGCSSWAWSPAPSPPAPQMAVPGGVALPTLVSGGSLSPFFAVAVLRVTPCVVPTPCPVSRAGPGRGQQGACPVALALERGLGGLSSRGSAVPQAEEEKRRKKEEAARKRQEQEVASASAGGARSRKAL